jgi:general secretion pathway protein J
MNARTHLKRRGFTLLEVLLAVAIFSVVLIAIHMVFYGAIKLQHTTTEAIESKVAAQHAVAILKRDLAGIVRPGGTLFGELQTTATSGALGGQPTTASLLGQASSVPGQSSPAFHTASMVLNDNSPWSEVARVQYFLVEPTNNAPGKELFRSVTRNLLPTLHDEAESQFLLSGVESMFFFFYDGNQWRDYWDSTAEPGKLPQAIKVELVFASENPWDNQQEPMSLVVPLVAQANPDASEGGQP